MYTPSWLSDQSLIDSLQQEPWRWQSAQAVRVFEYSELLVEQYSNPAYSYPMAELTQVSFTDRSVKLISTLPALSGYNSVLPYAYQDIELRQRLAQDCSGIYDFISIFNNRILRLQSQVVLRSHLSVRYEEERATGVIPGRQIFAASGLSPTRKVPVENLVRYSALLARKTTCLELLANILTDYFSFEFNLEPPPLVRMPLAKDCLTQLHSNIDHHTQSIGYLGKNALLGRSGYLLHSCVNIVISARSREEYQAIVGDPEMPPAILEISTIYFSCLARFRLQIKCPRSFLTSPRLSCKPTPDVARLGRLSCLRPELYPHQLITIDYPEGLIKRDLHAAA